MRRRRPRTCRSNSSTAASSTIAAMKPISAQV
jgi:hypothetical protein